MNPLPNYIVSTGVLMFFTKKAYGLSKGFFNTIFAFLAARTSVAFLTVTSATVFGKSLQ